jgi:hypothetical protein
VDSEAAAWADAAEAEAEGQMVSAQVQLNSGSSYEEGSILALWGAMHHSFVTTLVQKHLLLPSSM